MHPGSLVRTIDVGLALPHHLFPFVRTVGRLGAHGQLPTHGDTTGGIHNPVVAITLVELRTLGGMVYLTSVENDAGLTDGTHAVLGKFADGQHTVETAARVGPAIHHVAASVAVPQRARVYHAFAGNDTNRFRPLASRVFGLDHHDAVVRVAPVDIKLAVVMADGWSPHTLAVSGFVKYLLGFLFLQGMTDDGPIHQVLGVQDGQSGDAVERRGRQIIVLTNGTHVWVTVVGIKHRIGVRTVTIVRTPHLRRATGYCGTQNDE